ncbi:hypothetical protein GRJ2_003361900 [Grus japonensis]|uniref:Uncharacterized protein n=1 Tax=Grus japonensis TaxID=30415 RepID=A0ABC9YJU6_GRUJA
MATWDKPDLDCSPLLDVLKSYKACPTPKGHSWAEGHWQSPTTVAEQIRDLAKENKFKPGKGKAVVCSILGAALIAAQKDKCVVKQAEQEANECLQELVKKLQAELEMEWVKRQLAEKVLVDNKRIMENLKGSLQDAFVRERELKLQLPGDLESEPGFSSLSKEANLVVREVAPHYPWEELRAVTEPDPTPKLRPLIKTEVVYDSKPAVTTKERPHTITELAKLQEKYSRQAKETETEYVWRVSLTGRDRIRLSEEEAQGYWSPSVFLTIDNEQEPWSLTQRVVYWAGGLDPLERGDPIAILTPGVSQLTESIQKAACLQLMLDRRLVPRQPSPMLLFANPDRMTPLIKGLPDSLKIYAVQIQDRLRATVAMGPQGRPGLTWGEIARELINYGQHVGYVGKEGKAQAAVCRTETEEKILRP